jgi:hypothetical protein
MKIKMRGVMFDYGGIISTQPPTDAVDRYAEYSDWMRVKIYLSMILRRILQQHPGEVCITCILNRFLFLQKYYLESTLCKCEPLKGGRQ